MRAEDEAEHGGREHGQQIVRAQPIPPSATWPATSWSMVASSRIGS